MKKFALFLAPLMAISFLNNCGSTKQYTVTFDSNGGTIVPSQTVEENKCATKPNDPVKVKEGYTCSFLHWESDNKEFDFNTPIVKNITLTAKWQEAINQYTVSVTSEDTSKGTVSGGGSYAYGSSVTIEATAKTGYSFEGWYNGSSQVSTDASYTFKMPANIVSYEARFTTNQYTVNLTTSPSEGGTVTGGGPHAYNSSVTIKATPKTGYSFDGWYQGGSKAQIPNPYSFTMPTNNVSYEARFSANQYTVNLTASPSEGGTVTGGGPHAYNSSVTIKATPKTGYSFEGWYKNGEKVPLASASYTFTMPANDVSYEARFTANQYTVTLTASPSGGGTVSGGGSYAYGSSVTIEATAKTGYSFEGWYNGSSQVSTDASYTFKMPANNVSYEAKFLYRKNAWYNKSDWWNYCSNGKDEEQATKDDIGKEVDLTVNGQVHKVRLIDIDHDVLGDGTTNTAHCTFEFSNLLSDSDGYSLATLWNTKNGEDSTNYNYLNSDLRKALDNQGNGTLRWYQKSSSTKSTTYTKPVIDMLPDELKANIKTVKKKVATTSSYTVPYTVTNYDAKVFALTHDEMTKTSSPYAKEEGTIYKYYEGHDNDSSRIKQQVQGHIGAITKTTPITDITCQSDNYAGYNSSTRSYGGIYWLASPCTDGGNYAWYVYVDGVLGGYCLVYSGAFAVTPAFCI